MQAEITPIRSARKARSLDPTPRPIDPGGPPRSLTNPYTPDDSRAELFDAAAALLDNFARANRWMLRARWCGMPQRLSVEMRCPLARSEGWSRGPSPHRLCSFWLLGRLHYLPKQQRGAMRLFIREVFEAIADADQRGRINASILRRHGRTKSFQYWGREQGWTEQELGMLRKP